MPTAEVSPDGTLDSRQLRHALGRFPTGVTVITTTAHGKREGLTANSFSALSLDPPLVLWSLGRKSSSLPGFMAASHFAIQVLAADQSALSHRFAVPSDNKFQGLEVSLGLGGCPMLAGTLASFECATERTLDGGDHVLFVGRVLRLSFRDGEPLVFSAGQYCSALPMYSPTADADRQAVWAGLG